MTVIAGGVGEVEEPLDVPVQIESAIQVTAERIRLVLEDDSPRPGEKTEEAARQVWGLIYGYLRGRVPNPVPFEIESVATSAGLRIAKSIAEVGTLVLDRGSAESEVEFKAWSGFYAVERMMLDRYRQRTA